MYINVQLFKSIVIVWEDIENLLRLKRFFLIGFDTLQNFCILSSLAMLRK